MNVTREQLNAALSELAGCGTADAIGLRLFREGCRGEAVEACRCPVAAWLRRRFPQARHIEVYTHVVILDGVLSGRLADSTLTLDAEATNGLGLKSNANIVLPTEASAAPFRLAIARQQPMRGKFFASGEIRPLWDLLVGGERSLSGQVRTQGTIGGTLAEAGDVLLEPLRTALGQRIVATSRGPVEVIPSTLGADAGVRGALAAALDQARMFGSLGVGQ